MSRYSRTIKGVTIDLYDIFTAYGVTCHARGHAIKKLLCAGERGHKDAVTDLNEAATAVARAIEIEEAKLPKPVDEAAGGEAKPAGSQSCCGCSFPPD